MYKITRVRPEQPQRRFKFAAAATLPQSSFENLLFSWDPLPSVSTVTLSRSLRVIAPDPPTHTNTLHYPSILAVFQVAVCRSRGPECRLDRLAKELVVPPRCSAHPLGSQRRPTPHSPGELGPDILPCLLSLAAIQVQLGSHSSSTRLRVPQPGPSPASGRRRGVQRRRPCIQGDSGDRPRRRCTSSAAQRQSTPFGGAPPFPQTRLHHE